MSLLLNSIGTINVFIHYKKKQVAEMLRSLGFMHKQCGYQIIYYCPFLLLSSTHFISSRFYLLSPAFHFLLICSSFFSLFSFTDTRRHTFNLQRPNRWIYSFLSRINNLISGVRTFKRVLKRERERERGACSARC